MDNETNKYVELSYVELSYKNRNTVKIRLIMYNIVNLGYLYQGRIKSKQEMCPKNTDAPAWKTFTQMPNAWKCNFGSGRRRMDERTRVKQYALSTIFRMAGA